MNTLSSSVRSGRYRYMAAIALAAFLILAFTAGCGHKAVTVESPSIVPAPSKMTTGQGAFTIPRDCAIYIQPGDSDAVRVADMLAGYINAVPGYAAEVKSEAAPASKKNIISLVVDSSSVQGGNEAYTLAVTADGVSVKAASPAGLFYGVQTIRQLLPPEIEGGGDGDGDLAIPCVAIEDAPRFVWRGMHLDVSRHYFTVADVKKYIDILALHKMNTFHWHLTDGTGWRIEIKKYPRLTEYGAWRKDTGDEPWSFTNIWPAGPNDEKYGGFYTQDDVREIVAYAADRFITVIPEIEMPGHASAALFAYPEYLCRNAEKTNREYGNSGVFCAGKDETFAFLGDVLDEVIALFPSKYIHIGGDEVPKRYWKACPDCQKRMKQEKLASEEELQSYFIRRMEAFLVSRGKNLVGWDEILEGGLAPEATVMSWRGMNGGVEAARQNHDVIMTPEESCYFNHYQGDPDLEPKAWGGFTPLDEVYAFDPVADELTPDEAKHVIGAQGCLWTEFVDSPDMIEYMVVPRVAALAEVVWTPRANRNFNDFKTRMVRMYSRYEALGLSYARSTYNVKYDIAVDPSSYDATVTMSTNAAGNTIRYTTDGTPPSAASTEYTSPVTLNKTVHVSAASFVDGEQSGAVTAVDYIRHLASGKKPAIAHPYNSRYAGVGDMTLTNCLKGSKNYADGQWQAYLKVDLDAVIDLGEKTTVSRMASTYFHNPDVWIFMPASVEYAISDDGVNFTTLATVEPGVPMETQGPIIQEFAATFDDASGRFIRVRAKNIGTCPPWHAGAGGAAFMFADEFVVE